MSDDVESKDVKALRDMLCLAIPTLFDSFVKLDTESKMMVMSVARDRGTYHFLKNLSVEEFGSVLAAMSPENQENFIRLYKTYSAEGIERGDGLPPPPFPGLVVIQGGKSNAPKDEPVDEGPFK
jgi:hypothetical protein